MEDLIKKYISLDLHKILDYDKFNHISISHHSTKIEGSTLTEIETQVLLNEGLTPKGKPMNDSLMLKDHYATLLYILQEAKNKRKISINFIQEINAGTMKSTGAVYNTIFGQIDASKGMFRKGNVSAGVSYFPNFDKVEKLTAELMTIINEKLQDELNLEEQLNLSFDAHFSLVSIHPFYDGNGRTSRLLMNYLQAWFQLPLAVVYSEDKSEYIAALVESREKDDIHIFRNFMNTQYAKFLNTEIEKFEKVLNPKKGNGFHFLF